MDTQKQESKSFPAFMPESAQSPATWDWDDAQVSEGDYIGFYLRLQHFPKKLNFPYVLTASPTGTRYDRRLAAFANLDLAFRFIRTMIPNADWSG